MTARGVYSWSHIPGVNATADSTVNWSEGQSPSSVNDSARAMMASVSMWSDDISGYLGTDGTSTALTLATNQVYDTLAHLHAKVVGFTMHTTNGAGPVTLNVDGLGAKPLQASPGVDLPAGLLVQGTPYVALFNNVAGAFYLQSFFSQPYSVPIGAVIDFTGSTAPNSSFVLPYGQAISRTTYSTYFAMVATTYGSGDGSTTFNIPDLRGRVVAGKDDMGGSAASRLTATYFGTSAAALGATGGSESKVLVAGNLPPYTPAGTISGSVTSINANLRTQNSSGSNDTSTVPVGSTGGTVLGSNILAPWFVSGAVSATFTGTAQGGTSTPVAIAQPTIIMNKLLRII